MRLAHSTRHLVVRTPAFPTGNSNEDWLYLSRASKAARWLRCVPFEKIVDARNEAPLP